MRRKRVMAGVVVCAMACPFLLWLVWPGPGITRHNTVRITPGGTDADVEALFGAPAGVYTVDGVDWAAAVQTTQSAEDVTRKRWVGTRGRRVRTSIRTAG